MAAADVRGALSRSRVVSRGLLYAAQVLGMVVSLRALAEFPWVAAAAPSILRVATSFLAPQCICFLAANGIVIALATLKLLRCDAASSSPSSADPSGSPGSNGDALHNPFLEFLDPPPPTLPPITEAEPSGEKAPPEVVFEDKEAVHVKTVRAQPPRRTMSEKTGGGAAAGRTASAAGPELRRAKSENGRRRHRRSAAAAPVDDGEAFRQVVEAFIAKQQTWFHREESLIIARAAAATARGGEDGAPAIAGGAAVAVK